MTILDLSDVYTSSHVYDGQDSAVLRCGIHPDWEVDVDGTDLPSVIRRAENHVRDEHRTEEQQ